MPSKNPEVRRAANRRYKERHREKLRSPESKAKHRAYCAIWRERNRETIRSYQRQWDRSHYDREQAMRKHLNKVLASVPQEIRDMRAVLYQFRSRLVLDARTRQTDLNDTPGP